MSLLLLYALASADAMFTGFRSAEGRNFFIGKDRYYLRALGGGLLAGQILLGAGAIAGAWIWSSLNAEEAARATAVADRLALGYGAFAVLIFLAFGFRLVPSVDVKCLTSVLIFGPLTLLRPFVALAGVFYLAGSGLPGSVTAFAALLVAAFLLLGRVLDMFERLRQDKHVSLPVRGSQGVN